MNEKILLDRADVKFSVKSMVDDFGRVFFFNEKVYRAIYPQYEEYCLSFLKSELFEALTLGGYIPHTALSDLKMDGFCLILEHERLLEIQQHEWSYEMFKAAAVMTLQLNEVCNRYGYELKDAHTFNVLFRGTEPVYADIGSIVPKTGKEWTAMGEFIGVFYYPIQFYLQNEYYVVRKLVESNFYRLQTAPFQELDNSALPRLMKQAPFYYTLSLKKKVILTTDRHRPFLAKIIKGVNKIGYGVFRRKKIVKYERKYHSVGWLQEYIGRSVMQASGSEWAGYHKANYTEGGSTVISDRFNRIVELINSMDEPIGSVIDLAGNEGLFSGLLVQKTTIPRIILTDYDANAIDAAYNNFKNLEGGRISVALLNFIFTPDVENTAKRLRADVAVALAVTHHLVLSQHYSIDVIFERLKLFAKKYVLVEFMPLGLWSAHTKTGAATPEWYNEDWFREHFEKHFGLLHREELEENRVLYIGKI